MLWPQVSFQIYPLKAKIKVALPWRILLLQEHNQSITSRLVYTGACNNSEKCETEPFYTSENTRGVFENQ